MQDLIRDFVVETVESLDALDGELLRFEKEADNQVILTKVYRLLHTIKGTCGFLDLGRLERLAHGAESLISRLRDGHPGGRDEVTLVLMAFDRIRTIIRGVGETGHEPEGSDRELITVLEACAQHGAAALAGEGRQADAVPLRVASSEEAGPAPEDQTDPLVVRQNVRVSVDRLDHLMSMVSELILVRNQLIDVARREGAGPFKLPLQRLSSITGELQDGVMRTRMMPIKGAWAKAARMARDLSAELGKAIVLDMQGGDTEIDRQILEVIRDCLVHMIRNAADHGIERPEERVAAGKAPEGTIRLKAQQEGSQIVFSIEDDGRGLNRDRIASRAAAAGLVTEDALFRMSDQEVYRLVFMPGFTLAEGITHVSGRGIGLDAVRFAIEQVGGTADVVSQPGVGTNLVLRLPLTLAVAGVLVVEAAGQLYAMPQVSIAELVRVQPGSEVRYERLGDGIALRMREALLPVADLASVLSAGAHQAVESGFVMICEVGRQRFALAVDAIHQTEDIVVKPLSPRLRHIPFYSGATILGDGSVILILEATGFADLVHSLRRDDDEPHPVAAVREPPVRLTTLLVHSAGAGLLRAVPMALIARLEEFEASAIETVGGHRLIAYHGGLLPLVPGGEGVRPNADGLQPVMVFEQAGRAVGVMVDDILDVVDAELSIALDAAEPGTLGTALVGDQMMRILDVAALFSDSAMTMAGQDGAPPVVLLLEPSGFFQALLAPVIEAAGYAVRLIETPADLARGGERGAVAAIVADLDRHEAASLAAVIRGQIPHAPFRMLGLATRRSAAILADAREAGFHAVVGKFDRQMLIKELGARHPAQGVAA